MLIKWQCHNTLATKDSCLVVATTLPRQLAESSSKHIVGRERELLQQVDGFFSNGRLRSNIWPLENYISFGLTLEAKEKVRRRILHIITAVLIASLTITPKLNLSSLTMIHIPPMSQTNWRPLFTWKQFKLIYSQKEQRRQCANICNDIQRLNYSLYTSRKKMIIKPKAALWKNNLISRLSEPRTRTKRK